MKKTVLFLVLAILVAGGVFAQEQQAGKTGYIKPTWGLGFAVVSVEYSEPAYDGRRYYTRTYWESETLFALSLDVDFVNAFGLTLGLQTAMAWNGDMPAEPLPSFGIGYTYTANVWSVGAKLMAVPFMGGGLGFDINGTYWFNRHIGITGITDIYFTANDARWVIFSMRVGVSTRL